MGKRIYVGNLPWSTTSDSLKAMFAEHGSVRSAEVVSDRETGRSRGFYRKHKLSRIALRELGNKGLIPGLVKSSW